MTWRRVKEAGERWLSVTNAHYGPTKLAVPLRPIRHKESAAILGFEAAGPWASRAPDSGEASREKRAVLCSSSGYLERLPGV